MNQREEGDVIASVSGPAVEKWRSGDNLKAWSSRLESVSLKVGHNGTDMLHVVRVVLCSHFGCE